MENSIENSKIQKLKNSDIKIKIGQNFILSSSSSAYILKKNNKERDQGSYNIAKNSMSEWINKQELKTNLEEDSENKSENKKNDELFKEYINKFFILLTEEEENHFLKVLEEKKNNNKGKTKNKKEKKVKEEEEIKEEEIKEETNDKEKKYFIYKPREDVKIELGYGVLAILQSAGYKITGNESIILTNASSNRKYQFIKTHNEVYETCEWFKELYDHNILGSRFEMVCNISENKIRFENYFNYDYTKQNKNLHGFNKIYYGIPGCGKSYKVSAMLGYKKGFEEEAEKYGITSAVDSEFIFRTTFFLDYTNSDFVGQIYPVVDGDRVEYKPVLGPFTKALIKALLNPDQMVYLVIEEINRGNAAAIFGDLFQLLDRVKTNDNGRIIGESEYPISNEFIEGYIRDWNKTEDEQIPYEEGNIYIPNNLSIFATMNTSDQNVFPLDTAFKRRWSRERIIPDWNKVSFKEYYIPYTSITWEEFATKVNAKMNSCKDGTVSSDKNLGPYFISSNVLSKKKNEGSLDQSLEFMNNVVDYLYNDVTKFNHELLFNDQYSYDEIYNYFCEEKKDDQELKNKFKDIFTVDFIESSDSNAGTEKTGDLNAESKG